MSISLLAYSRHISKNCFQTHGKHIIARKITCTVNRGSFAQGGVKSNRT
jgi:hypothetical protein